MDEWSAGNWYDKRAVVAALAEPRLLKRASAARAVLKIFDRITKDIVGATDPRNEAFKVLRQSMAYGWSVAVAALPDVGKPLMEKWARSRNADVRWIIRQNLKKNRLVKIDTAWVKACTSTLEAGG